MKDMACFLFLDPQNEICLSISSSVVLCSFVLLVYIVKAYFGILFVSILCKCCSHSSWHCFISFTKGCPTRYQTRHFFNNFTTNEDIATKFEADLPHCVRNVKTTNVPLFKFRCNIFIGVRIIKEMPGSVVSGTFCIFCSNLNTIPSIPFRITQPSKLDQSDLAI
jgi:hypothetical protein